MKKLTEEQLARKGKMYLMMPVIVVPFLTLVFWALGGGAGEAAPTAERSAEGINTELPGAKNKDDGGLDKMGFYELADQDSLKRKEAIRNDPYYSTTVTADTAGSGLVMEQDENEKKVYQKLDELNRELEKGSKASAGNNEGPRAFAAAYNPAVGDVDRLEELLAASREKDSTVDPETHALNNMLEKILDIQHPQRVRDKLQKASEEKKGLVLPVYTGDAMDIRAVENVISDDPSPYFSQTIAAEIAESKTLYEEATVKMRLLSDVFIMGKLIPRNTFVTGTVSFHNMRMQIAVSSIYFQQIIFPVKLWVYDLQGIKGLELQANMQSELARQSGDRGLQNMNIPSLDPSIGAQAATAGIEVAKNVLSKKIRQVKVPIKAGEQVLLYSDEQTK